MLTIDANLPQFEKARSATRLKAAVVVAIILLNAEEAALAMSGELAEPSYRPYPGSIREREMEEEREAEYSAWSQWAEEDEEESVETVELVPGTLRQLQYPNALRRIGSAQFWKESTSEIGVLATRRRADGEPLVVGLGSITGGRRAAPRGTRDLTVTAHFLLGTAIPLNELMAGLREREKSAVRDAVDGPSRPLPPGTGRSFTAELASVLPNYSEAVGTIRATLNQALLDRAARRPVNGLVSLPREAMSSALHFFATSWHKLQPIPDPQPSEFAVEMEATFNAIENDFITDDASTFPGWDRSRNSTLGWWEFRDSGRRLQIKNINVSPAETATGADLVYIRRNPDAFVLVQYKLVEKLKSGRLIFRPDVRIAGQIERLLKLEAIVPGMKATNEDDYRIGPGFAFLKFVFPAEAQSKQPGKLVPGYYLPVAFADNLLENPDTGPKGASVHYVAEHRYLTPDLFARLVRDRWVGSVGDASEHLRAILGVLEGSAGLVLAVDEPYGDGQTSMELGESKDDEDEEEEEEI